MSHKVHHRFLSDRPRPYTDNLTPPENLVGYGKDDLARPLLLEHAERLGGDETAAAAAVLADLPAANQRATAWCQEVNAAEHSETCTAPAQRLSIESGFLKALPSLRPRIGPAPATRKVDTLSTIRWASARYSFPRALIGSSVAVVVDGSTVQVLDPATGEVHAEHQLVGPGESSIVDAHYGSSRPTTPVRAIRAKTIAEKQFCALGPAAEAFIAGAAAAGHTRLGPELAELNTLTAAHGTQAMTAALERAISFRRWKADDVRSILSAGPGVPQPRPAGDALVIDLPTATGRSLTEYTPTAATSVVSS